MPLYETLSEKLVVVIDIGASYTKFGFAGESAPRCIIRSQVKNKTSGNWRPIYDYQNKQDLYDLLVDFVHLLYFKYALFSPKDRPIVIVESLLSPTVFRETLAKVLFMHYEVSMILVLPSHLVSLATLGIDTGLVVDCGYTEIVTIPICYGVVILSAWQAVNLGARTIHSHLRQLLIEENGATAIQNLPESTMENIKVRCCFVTRRDRALQLLDVVSAPDRTVDMPQVLQKNAADVEYPLGSSGTIRVPGRIREQLFEILYEEDEDHLSLSNSILDALLKVDLNVRILLADNIVLIGGAAQTVGFQSRLQAELFNQLKTERYSKLNFSSIRFHTAPAKENYTAWLGGAIYGATDILHLKGVTREYYLREKRLPDWVNMKDNARVSA